MKKFTSPNGQEFYLAPSYQTTIYRCEEEPFYNLKNKRYVRISVYCNVCGGSSLNNFDSLHNSCPACLGSGVKTKTVRAYTKSEYLSSFGENEARAKTVDINAAKLELAKKIGFGSDLKAYLVYGDNTYAIKNILKEKGARFNPILKWYFATEQELPEGYFLCPIDFDDIYKYNPLTNWVDYKETAKEVVSKKIAELKEPSTFVFYPAPEGSRLRNITAKVEKIKGFNGIYGYTRVYNFVSGDYYFVWMTASQQQIACGDIVDLTGTIKKFDEYMGIKGTHLSRCKVIKID